MAQSVIEPGRRGTTAQSGDAAKRRFSPVKPALLTIALMAVGLALVNGLVDSLGRSPQFSFALAGSLAVYLATRPARHEAILVAGMGIALRLWYGAAYGIQPYFGSIVISSASFTGIAALAALACKAIRRRAFADFGTAAYFPFVSIVVGFILPVTNRLSPQTFDTHLLAADGATGFQPSFLLGRLIDGRPLLWDLTSTVYHALPLSVALLCAAHIYGSRREEVARLLWLFATMSVVGFCVYAVCPATGPAYAFREWFPMKPEGASHLLLETLSIPGAPRNAIPSLHFSTALLVYWNVPATRRTGKVAAAIFLAATTFAILALGEHYLVDAVVAVPFSVTFQVLFGHAPAARRSWRYVASWGAATLAAVWLLALRYSAEALSVWPAATVAALLATIGLSLRLRTNLAAAGGSRASSRRARDPGSRADAGRPVSIG